MVNKFPHGDFKCKLCKDRNYIVQCKCSPNCTETFPRVDKYGILREFALGHAVRVREQSGEKNPFWKGGQSFNKVTGYWTSLAPNHPFAWENGRVPTHRLIYEKYLSELAGEEVYIAPELDVHHKNEIKTDNRIENLEVVSHGEHTTGHNKVDMQNRFCHDCGTKTPQMKRTKKGTIIPDWRAHPSKPNSFLCKKCAQRSHNKRIVVCIDCKEQRKLFSKGLCERCYDRKIRDSSPIIKCKMEDCENTFHEIDTNGRKREFCNGCRRIKNRYWK